MKWEKIMPTRRAGVKTPEEARFGKTCISINSKIWEEAGKPSYVVVMIDRNGHKLGIMPASAHDPYSVRVLKPKVKSRYVVYIKYSALIRRLGLDRLSKAIEARARWDENEKIIMVDIPKEVVKNACPAGR